MKKLKQIGIFVGIVVIFTLSAGYKSDFFEVAKQIEIYTTLFKELNMYYIDETNPAELTDAAISNMLEDLDPYTRYYDEQGVEKARINAAGKYGGIGAETKIINKALIVTEPYEKGPANKAGIKAGDEIIKINNTAIGDTPLRDVMFLLNGSPNTEITLQLKRQDELFTTHVTRETIEEDPVPYYKMIDDEVGYISFIKFNTKASSQVKEAFEDLKAQGMTKLVLDIRGNLGGLLNEAVEITNFFVPKDEVVVTTKAKVKKWSDVYKTKRAPLDLEIPIVVLIDRFSASASEIVAGSLQDLDRAIIVGERSFGKGLVQRYRKLTYGTQLKITISKYYTPSGRSIQELDYTHRDRNGSVPKFSDNKRNAFKTKNGRTVYDGGGIEPDIKLKKEPRTNATDALLNSDAIFNYATNYYFNNKEVPSSESFQFSNSDYAAFLNYLNSEKVNFKTSSEEHLEAALKASKEDGFSATIQNNYVQLLASVNADKIKNLTKNRTEIKEILTNEIVRRYYYKKGEYIHKVHNDQSIIEALSILKDENKYRNILIN